MRKWSTIQLHSNVRPRWVELIHEAAESIVVGAFKQMHHFVYDNVLKAFGFLLPLLRVDSNSTGFSIAIAPARFHSLHVKTAGLDLQYRLPLFN